VAHGDPRGSWHNGRFVGPDPYLEAATRAGLTADAVVLSAVEREIVAKAFGEVIREQGHRVYAAAIQETHVHLIFAPLRENLTNVVARLKRRSTMAVHERWQHPARMAGLYSRAILARQNSL
jgi:REP element-mobilizing transposase RayT